MATTSTIGLARIALTSALQAVLTASFYAWPGPHTAERKEVMWIDSVKDWTQSIPNLKAGRKQRQESYTFEVVIWVAKPEEDAEGAQATFERTLVLMAGIEDRLANDVQLTETAIQLMVSERKQVELVPYEKGWACQLIMDITGEARLT